MRRPRRPARGRERRAPNSYKTQVRIVVSLLILAVFISLGAIKGSEPSTVYAQSDLGTPQARTSDDVPPATPTLTSTPTSSPTFTPISSPTPSPTSTPRPALRPALRPASGPKTAASPTDLTTNEILALIRKYFPKDAGMAQAVFRAESGLNPTAKNWNCRYWENGRQVSRTCRVEDRGRAWSVDCGLTQINQAGIECPSELFEVETNLKRARAKYDAKLKEGLDPWSPWAAYLQGSYKQFLD